MEQTQVDAIYKKKIFPIKIFGIFNALISLSIIFFFFNVMISRAGSEKFKEKFTVTVLPMPLNEMESIKDKEKRNYYNKTLFQKYAKKVTINNAKDMYRLMLRISRLPLNRPRYVEIAFEVYNNERDYLFTFYADNFWHQSGYDDGYWHQWNYTERVDVKFPYNGEYYFVAAIGKNTNSRAMYDAVRRYANGELMVHLYKGVKPVSMGTFVFAFVIFTVITVILFKTSTGAMAKRKMSSPKIWINFEKNHYIVKLPDKISKKPFYVSGYIVKTNKKGTAEYILTQNNVNTYLEVEQEIEYDDDSRKTSYYFYYYETLPEDEFDNVPEGKNYLNYKNHKFKETRDSGKPKKYKIVYSNGLSEEIEKTVINFGTTDEKQYLSFEWIDNKDNFDVSYGYEIKGPKIWEVKNHEGTS